MEKLPALFGQAGVPSARECVGAVVSANLKSVVQTGSEGRYGPCT
ncbi:hypothetical protein AtDm6_3318 [Acetobacter tropicalis]|uniref:Uncharacterized protein n=1 Tax=Acetobacter tropicalis TaxID=104102 RepID=A0A095AVZ8_9PROT|nr:hypothetical protein AtDm6_3318 [Acetobacter tropicalis]